MSGLSEAIVFRRDVFSLAQPRHILVVMSRSEQHQTYDVQYRLQYKNGATKLRLDRRGFQNHNQIIFLFSVHLCLEFAEQPVNKMFSARLIITTV